MHLNTFMLDGHLMVFDSNRILMNVEILDAPLINILSNTAAKHSGES